MGTLKDQEIEKDENWRLLCKSKGWVCALCGEPPSREEGAPDAAPWHCGNCSYMIEND